MINEIELEIVRNYVNKNRQERIIWEFDNHKRRENIMLKRFASPDIFKKNCMDVVEYLSPNALEKYLSQFNKETNIYFIGENYIGDLSLKQAVNRANTGEICIIYCGNGIGYYQGEQENGKVPRFLLLKEN